MDKIIPFNKGIRRQPSLGEAGELSELVNLIPKGGELVNVKGEKKVVGGLKIGSEIWKLLCTHSTDMGKNFIITNGSALKYYRSGSGASGWSPIPIQEGVGKILNVTAIGNVLVVACENTVCYELFKEGAYQYVSGDFPDLSLTFGLRKYDLVGGDQTIKYHESIGDSGIAERVYQAMKGDLNEAKKDYFVSPFFVRYAYRMYDGSLMYHSSPVFMPCCTEDEGLWITTYYEYNNSGNVELTGRTIAFKHKLSFYVRNADAINELKEYRDLIRSVDIFVSNPITMLGEASDYKVDGSQSGIVLNDYKSYSISKGADGGRYERQYLRDLAPGTININSITTFRADRDKVKKSIEDCSNFYLLKSYKIDELPTGSSMIEVEIPKSYLLSLATREVMSDDYNTRAAKSALGSFSYNSRVHLYGVREFLIKDYPIDSVCVYKNTGNLENMSMYVHTKIGANDAVVKINAPRATMWSDAELMYIYYPDPNASKLTIGLGSTYYEIALTRHNFLYGSYAYADFGNMLSDANKVSSSPTITTDTGTWRKNYIYYSLVDNPFMFPASNVVAVGSAEIQKISTSAKALSQGQFGQYPLYAFCTDGVWALEIAEDGSIGRVAPISRDVCNNPDSITQIDGAVVFTTDQGLKMIQGSEVVLLSGYMDGYNVKEGDYFPSEYFKNKGYADFDGLVKEEDRDFRKILEKCRIAYDYPNNMLRIYPKENKGKYYVFDLGTREFSSCIDDTEVETVVADYPSSFVQKGDSVYSFDGSPTNDRRNGLLLTRPISLDDPSAFKKLQELKLYQTRTKNDSYAKVCLFVSNDGITWAEKKSLRGGSYRYFRFGVITSMMDDEALSGMAVRYETNRANKLR